MDISHIRNFCIIAHIDHGKSTLADRILETTGTLTAYQMRDQVLDTMDIERERGITIKAQSVRIYYDANNGERYELNLIDTPGHVDFSYEVSRTIAACEGALLLVDVTQGIEAQTVSNLYMALEHDLTIIPIINKIDVPHPDIDHVKTQILELLGGDESDILLASGKTGIGVKEILEAIVHRIPPPKGDPNAPLKALIFDSVFDTYRGAVPYVRIFDGTVKKGDKIKMFSTEKIFDVDEVGSFKLGFIKEEQLSVGDVGYIISSIKNVRDAKVGDTITFADNPTDSPLPGYKEPKPMVYSGLYPVSSDDYDQLRDSLDKLKLNDASLVFEQETSVALGFGFRCGFLGLLHMEIIRERLEREYNMSVITTVPNVQYRVTKTDGEVIMLDSPAKMPAPNYIATMEEPFVSAQIVTPTDYIGDIMRISQEKRGEYKTMEYLDSNRAVVKYEFPLAEIIFDYYDKLKSVSKGYASLDYELIGYREAKLVKLDILINGSPVDALSIITHRDKAYEWGRALSHKLRQLIPRQMFEVSIQAAIGSKIIAKETVKPFRKNVTAKCYGGDITRKRKLLEIQKEGKKRMKQIGKVEIPQEAFLAILKVEV